jgi:hypothetical protein
MILLKNPRERFKNTLPMKFLDILKICRRTKEEIEQFFSLSYKDVKKQRKGVGLKQVHSSPSFISSKVIQKMDLDQNEEKGKPQISKEGKQNQQEPE